MCSLIMGSDGMSYVMNWMTSICCTIFEMQIACKFVDMLKINCFARKNDFQVSTPVLTQILYHEIGKVITGNVPHWMPARESCLTPRKTDPWS